MVCRISLAAAVLNKAGGVFSQTQRVAREVVVAPKKIFGMSQADQCRVVERETEEPLGPFLPKHVVVVTIIRELRDVLFHVEQ